MFIFKTTNIHKLLILLYVLVFFSCRTHSVDSESLPSQNMHKVTMEWWCLPILWLPNVGVDILKMGGETQWMLQLPVCSLASSSVSGGKYWGWIYGHSKS